MNVVVHLYGKPWLLRPAAPVASPVRILHPYAIEPRGVALLVSIAQEVEPLWKLWAAARGLNHPLEVVQVEPPEGRQRRTSLETAEEASAWAFAIGEAARAAKERAGGPIHVFAATPGPLSIAIGQELHALGPVTLWDRHPTEDRYRASYTFST